MAISPFGHRKVALSSRGESVIASAAWRSRLNPVKAPSGCREERGDLCCSGLANSQKRDCRATLAMTILLSKHPLGVARNVAISPFCHREERGDLGCSGLANSQKRDCRATLAMTTFYFAGSQPPSGALTGILCHREERGDLGCLGMANG